LSVSGTEVTKEAARMILADDHFATIVLAVREARGVLDNIRKFLRYLLSSNIAEVLTVFVGVVGAGVIGLEATATGSGGAVVLPLLTTQILWINLVTDTGPALAMGVDPIAEDVMARQPRPRSQRIVDARMGLSVLESGVVMAVALSTALQVAVVHLPFLNLAFGTVPLSLGQWGVCVAMASVVLWFSEARKLVRRLWARRVA
jgi:magnesium-transporting ATPase (P-type)